MQVTFDGHDYLFVNPKLAGKYMPPSQDQWFNYGGDKLWLLPEGNDDEQHWRGNSDVLDDGPFAARDLSDGKGCGLELDGIARPSNGNPVLAHDSPRVRFASHRLSRGHDERERAWSRVVHAVRDAVRHERRHGSLTEQSHVLGNHSDQQVQWIPESLSRSHWSGREPCGNGEGRWLVLGALRAPGGRAVGRYDRWLARRRRSRQRLCHDRALSVRRARDPIPGRPPSSSGRTALN